MSKFVLIDQSLVDFAGHHYEYAARVLNAATRLGFEPVLGTHLEFMGAADLGWDIRRVYRYGYFDAASEPSSPIERSLCRLAQAQRAVRSRVFKKRAALAFSPFMLLRPYRRQPRQTFSYARSMGAPLHQIALLLVLQQVANAWVVVRDKLLTARELMGSRSDELRPTGTDSSLEASRETLRSRGRIPAIESASSGRKRAAFSRDTEELLQGLQLGRGDIIFVPTLAGSEMEGLLDYWKRDAGGACASTEAAWHLLFRREAAEGCPAGAGGPKRLQEALAAVRDACPLGAITLWADTEALAAEYARSTQQHFGLLPIPVGEEFVSARATSTTPSVRLAPVLAYAGDARHEKGYPLLPELVARLLANPRNFLRPHFLLQSNFNTPGGEAACVVARAQLEAMQSSEVELMTEPLGPMAYRSLIARTDVMLLLHEAQRYRTRSSGIFAEVMAAGRPAVLPAGTWMAAELCQANADYHRRFHGSPGAISHFSSKQLSWRVEPAETVADSAVVGRDDATIDAPETFENGRIDLGRGVKASSELDVPGDATHMTVVFEHGREAEQCWTKVSVSMMTGLEPRKTCLKRIVGGGPGAPGSLLIPLRSGVSSLVIEIRAASKESGCSIEGMELAFHRAEEAPPQWVVGAIYSERDEIYDCVVEVLEHLDHYGRTARRFSLDWSRCHDPQNLVACLASSDGAATSEHIASAPIRPASKPFGQIEQHRGLAPSPCLPRTTQDSA